ncbi:MAG TPA: hypothetical protein VFO62_01720 [Candidatus Binatia bacterium]|nr:hypothetical protein [Candidatus Binatia bacterium]
MSAAGCGGESARIGAEQTAVLTRTAGFDWFVDTDVDAAAMAQVTMVLPMPVSVPVTKIATMTDGTLSRA